MYCETEFLKIVIWLMLILSWSICILYKGGPEVIKLLTIFTIMILFTTIKKSTWFEDVVWNIKERLKVK